MSNFFGKYRGKVTQNKDPLHLGRVQVTVPAIYGDGRNSWAMPCTPYAGKDIGFFTVPPIDTNIWVEFEGGDPDHPIWSGCFWGEDQLPKNARVDDPEKVQVFRTHGITITLSNLGDNKGLSIVVENPVVEKPLKMIFNADGIEVNDNNQTTGKWMSDKIELKNGSVSTATLTADSIQLQEGAIEIKLTNNSIELNSSPAQLSLSTAAGIKIGNAPSSAKFAADGIQLSNGVAQIKLSPISVNINNGALEIT
jgi:Type VI secretion system/phage-baseplate injector OB domain